MARGDDSDTSSLTLTEVPTNHSRLPPSRPSLFALVVSHALVTPAVLEYDYNGAGTAEDPFVVEFIPDDPRDPMGFPTGLKWLITILVAFVTLAVSFVSSCISGGIKQIVEAFDTSNEVAALGIALFVLGVRCDIPPPANSCRGTRC